MIRLTSVIPIDFAFIPCLIDITYRDCYATYERLLTPSFIPELAMRRCVPGKGTLRLFSIGSKQSTGCGGPA